MTLDELDRLHAAEAERDAFSARLRAAEAVLVALVACDDAIDRGDEPPLSRAEVAAAARAALGEP